MESAAGNKEEPIAEMISSCSMPSPLTPMAPINTPFRYNGKPPGKIVVPLGRFGLTVVEVAKTAPFTGFVAVIEVGVMIEKRSWRPKKRPGFVPTIPGGY